MNSLNTTVVTKEDKMDSPCSENPGSNLLDGIRSMRVTVGDELCDEEFTRLLGQSKPPAEAGFTFLSYCNRFVMFSVPKQELANWYPEKKGWIQSEKEKIAKEIAGKYGLSVCEPPDMKDPCSEAPNPHHHLQLSNRQEPIIIIHPLFLKIRLFALASYGKSAQKPLHMKCELLKDLSALYRS
jgi:hypothetical protein